jgi:hypothetical protein
VEWLSALDDRPGRFIDTVYADGGSIALAFLIALVFGRDGVVSNLLPS